MSSELEQAVRTMFTAVIAGGHYELLPELVTEDTVDHSPMGDVVGIDALADSLKPYREAMPDIQLAVSQFTMITDDIAIFAVHATGTFTGSLMGMPGNGNQLDQWVPNAVRFRDGKGAEHWGFSAESYGMFAAQLGLPAPPSGG